MVYPPSPRDMDHPEWMTYFCSNDGSSSYQVNTQLTTLEPLFPRPHVNGSSTDYDASSYTIPPSALHDPTKLYEDDPIMFGFRPCLSLDHLNLVSPPSLTSPESLLSDSSSDDASAPSSCFSQTSSLPSLETDTSDHDADGDSDYNDDDEDDEYTPSKASSSHKRRRASDRPHRKPQSSAPILKAVRKSPYPTTKRARLAPPPRHRQASASTSVTIERAVESSTAAGTDFVCPECGYKQTNRRMPDFKRHLRTHIRPSDRDETKGWWCKGMLYDDFLQLPASTQKSIRDSECGGETYLFLNKLRIGGCRSTFSRRDALKRHLGNAKISCIGKACSPLED